MKILVLPGDGIGPEITQATLAVLDRANAKFRLGLEWEMRDIGLVPLKQQGTTLQRAHGAQTGCRRPPLPLREGVWAQYPATAQIPATAITAPPPAAPCAPVAPGRRSATAGPPATARRRAPSPARPTRSTAPAG